MIDIFIDSLWITIPGFIVVLFCIPKFYNPECDKSIVADNIQFILIWNVLLLLTTIAAQVFDPIKVGIVWILFIMFCRKIID